MSISNKLLFIILFTFLTFVNLSTLKANEEKINLDDEELPAIDPFQGNSSNLSQNNDQTIDNSNTDAGILNGMRFVGTIISKNKKIAILYSTNGSTYKYQENEEISNGTILIEIFSEYLIVEDENSQLYEIYMNNVEKKIEG